MKRARHYPLEKEKVLEAANLSAAELRLLVSNYYQAQEMRKRMDMQMRHLGDKQPLPISTFASEAFADIEEQIKNAFGKLLTSPQAQWCLAQRGIGPVLTAGFLAHIDIHKAATAGAIVRFAGLDPSLKWEKGQKRPFNADLKQLTWHAGQCFMKQSNDPDCFYGRLYRKRKEREIIRNEAGGNAEKAAIFKVSPGATKAVKDKLAEGRMPDFNIDARARRYAVKIFLSHLHFIWFFHEFKRLAPLPYAIEHAGHVHEIMPQNCDLIPGLPEAMHKNGREWREAAE